MGQIHATAIVEEGAILGKDVVIEPYAVVKAHVQLGDRVTIKSHAYIDGHTTIGDDTTVFPFASIGTRTQDLKYRGEITYVKIGKRCQIREFVSVNASCGEGSAVVIGDDCLIMAYCHVAHNCTVGNGVIMSNQATLAGHVTVEDYAIIGGLTGVHQFSRIGKHAMVGGMSRVTHDVPPFTIGAGAPYKFGGLNLVGLKRHKFPLETRLALSKAFKMVYRSGMNLDQALEEIERQVSPIPEVAHWVTFCRETQRGLLGLAKEEATEEAVEETL